MGTETTHWRVGHQGMTHVTRRAAVWATPPAPHRARGAAAAPPPRDPGAGGGGGGKGRARRAGGGVGGRRSRRGGSKNTFYFAYREQRQSPNPHDEAKGTKSGKPRSLSRSKP